jgi:hypothetical protein
VWAQNGSWWVYHSFKIGPLIGFKSITASVQTERTSKSPPLVICRTSTSSPHLQSTASSLGLWPTVPLCCRRDSDPPCLHVAVTLIHRDSTLIVLQSTALTLSHSTLITALIRHFLHAAPPCRHCSNPHCHSSDPPRVNDTVDLVWSLTKKCLSVYKKCLRVCFESSGWVVSVWETPQGLIWVEWHSVWEQMS